MRILYIASELHWVGASISLLHLLRGMKSKGVEMLVVVPAGSPISLRFIKELVDLEILYVQIPLPWDIVRHENSKEEIKGLLKKVGALIPAFNCYMKRRKHGKEVLQSLIQEFNPDIVHTNVGVFHEGFEVCQELGIPHVWHLRDYHDLDFKWEPLPSWKEYRKQLNMSDVVITITDDIRRHYGLSENTNALTIYNGCFDANDISMSFPKDKFFFSASRLIEAKGHLDVINAFDIFYKNHTDYQLVLAGIGDENYIIHLKKIINALSCANAVKLIGHQKDVRPLMRKAKALIVASYHEGFGRMTAEAAFCGCLVIGRNTGGTKEILDETGGFLFEDSNAITGICNCMEKVNNLSDSIYKEMAIKAQKKAISLYSNESYIDKVYTVYKKILTHKSGGG